MQPEGGRFGSLAAAYTPGCPHCLSKLKHPPSCGMNCTCDCHWRVIDEWHREMEARGGNRG